MDRTLKQLENVSLGLWCHPVGEDDSDLRARSTPRLKVHHSQTSEKGALSARDKMKSS